MAVVEVSGLVKRYGDIEAVHGIDLVRTVLEVVGLVFVLAFGLSAMGVALASAMRSMQGFQVVMTF